ncbi:MAG: beta-phosphoglucomutase [Bacillota bacterium]
MILIKTDKTIKGVIFDLDGVITDTADYHFKSWKRLAEEENISFNKKDNEKLRGLTREKSLETILKEKDISPSQKKDFLKRKNDYFHEYISDMDESDLLPGVKKLLNRLKQKKIKMGVASSSKNARIIINRLGFEDFFMVIGDGNSVNKNKPAPDIFLYAADKMNIPPVKCVVIEDSKAGVEAAIKAGMKVVGIGPEKRVGKADCIYKEIKNIEIEQLLNFK